MSAPVRTSPWRAIHKVADEQVPAWFRVIFNAFMSGQQRFKPERISDVDTLRAASAMALNGIEAWLDDRLPNLILETVEAGVGAGIVGGSLRVMESGVRISFNRTNPTALLYAATRSAALVRDISETTRKGIQSVIEQGFREGLHPRQQAKLIKPLIGLTRSQAAPIPRIAATEGGKAAARYARRALDRRALTIARTETMKASNEGLRLLWEDQIIRGNLPLTIQRVWIVTPDDRLCPDCAALRGVVAPVKGSFPGGVTGPPLHPLCRCSQGLVAPTAANFPAAPVAPPAAPVAPSASIVPPASASGQAAVAKLKNNIRISGVGGGIPIDRARGEQLKKHLISEMERIGSMFPGLRSINPVHWTAAVDENVLSGRAIGLYSPGRYAIQIAMGPGRKPGGKSIDVGAFTVGSGWHDTIRHEFGHHVHMSSWMSPTDKGAWSKIWHDMGGTKSSIIHRNVSQYASTDVYELFAESFSAYSHPNYGRPGVRRLPHAIEEFMNRVLPKQGSQAAVPPVAVAAPPPPTRTIAPVPRDPVGKPGSKRTSPGLSLNNADRVSIIDRGRRGESISNIAYNFGVSKAVVSGLLKRAGVV